MQAIVTVGLGFGDEGKGATVDYLCKKHNADLVVRYSGGCQAGHNVRLADGREHTFAQFGAGTLRGARTYLGPQVIIDPLAMKREASHLASIGVDNPFSLLWCHNHCLVSTPLHQAANKIKELSRGIVNRHGSCGRGIGETRSYWLRYGKDAIFATDLFSKGVLADKLELLYQRLSADLDAFHLYVNECKEIDWFGVNISAIAEELWKVDGRIVWPMPDSKYPVIFEGAQGVLLDEWFGFHPHTTWSTVTVRHALDLLPPGTERTFLGITRAYMTRHGAGPLPTKSTGLTKIVSDPGNPWNSWQGDLRCGWLDLTLLEYAVKACGAKLDGLAVNCLDHIDDKDDCSWVAVGYQNCPAPVVPAMPCLEQQENYGKQLATARIFYRESSRQDIVARLKELAPVTITATGPTAEDRKEAQ